MPQSVPTDDELLEEAASEMRTDVESSLEQAQAALPDPDAFWNRDAENTLALLNQLTAEFEAEDAHAHLRDAKKWYTMGVQADAFANPDSLETEITELEATLTTVETAREQADNLAKILPQLKTTLEQGQ